MNLYIARFRGLCCQTNTAIVAAESIDKARLLFEEEIRKLSKEEHRLDYIEKLSLNAEYVFFATKVTYKG